MSKVNVSFGPVLSVTFGLCAVALGKMAAAADLLKERLKK